MEFIKEHGVEKFYERQKKRIELLETMIENFNDGRSRSFFCRATALLDLTSLENSLDSANQKTKIDNVKPDDLKTKAKILKEILNEVALKEGIKLK